MTDAGAIVSGALALDPDAFRAVAATRDGTRIALFVLLASGLSNAVGQSVALFANRVRPWRFVVSIAVGALLFAGTVLIWGAAVAALSSFAFSQETDVRQVARVVGLAHAPRLFAFLVLTPYFGSGIGAVLTVWTLLALTVGTHAIFGLAPLEAIAVLSLAWLAIELLSRTVGRPIVALARWTRRLAAGTILEEPADLLPRRGAAHDEEA